jgi:outer membrane protein TolC
MIPRCSVQVAILACRNNPQGEVMKVGRVTAEQRRSGTRRGLVLGLCLLLAPWANAQKIPFQRAITLAVTHSAGMGMAVADQMKARQGYLELRNGYIPQVIFGSGLGKTFGYPMSIEGSAPSIFNITSQSYLYNPAQKQFMRSARTEWNASGLTLQDQREATILETALTYIQLDQAGRKLAALQAESEYAGRAETISRERMQEGVDSKADVTRASLVAARVRLRLAELQGNVDVLRQRLSQLTGLDARELETDTGSIPARPEIKPNDDFVTRALQNSPAVKAAEEKAKASEQRAKGEHNALYPAIDFVANYGLFTKYNNLDLLFPQGRFSRNNATVGIAIKVPFMNASQRAHASAADADAIRARSEARAARDQVASDTLKLQRAVQQLTASRDVVQLEYEVAQADLETAQTRAQSGMATIKEQETARIEVSEKQAALADAQFELDRAQLQLLRSTGELEHWALP